MITSSNSAGRVPLIVIACCCLLCATHCRAEDDLVRKSIRALQDGQTPDRLRAVNQLTELGKKAKGAIPALIAALDDEDLSDHAAVALFRIGPEAVQPLIGALNGPSERSIIGAATALGLIGAPAKRATPKLVKALESKDANVRIAVINALGRIVDSAGVKAIKASLTSDPELRVRRTAATSLKLLGPEAKSAIPELIGALKAIDSLSKRPPPSDVPNFYAEVQNLRTELLLFEGEVTQALGAMGEAALPSLLELLDGPETRPRKAALSALGEIGAKAKVAAPAVTLCLQDKDPEIRATAIITLSCVGDETATVSAIRPLYKDPSGEVRMLAARTVLDLKPSDKDARKILMDGMRDRDAWTRFQAVQGAHVLHLKSDDVVAALGVASTDKDKLVRHQAGEALADLAPKVPGAIPFLVALLGDKSEEDKELRHLILERLREVHNEKRVVPALIRSLSDVDGAVRRLAAEALGEQGAEAASALSALSQMAKDDEDPHVRTAASLATRKIRTAQGKAASKN